MKTNLTVLITALCFSAITASAADFDQSHAAFSAILNKHVKDGWVNYRALKADPAPLRLYLRKTSLVRESYFNRWPQNDRLAFLFNLYNAATLQLILDNYPIKSIKDIGGFFSGPWKQKVVKLFGKTTTLGHLEHGIIRKKYYEARAHFALVCGAKGCPPLRSEPYVGARLNNQLEDQGRTFLAQTAKNRVATGEQRVYLSPIFKWFDDDFEESSGSVLKFVKPYFDKARQAAFSSSLSIRYTDYDWTLNDQADRR
jgi:hypothetical protein